MMDAAQLESDVQSHGLLRSRHGDDPALSQIVRAEVERFADRILDAAHLAPGMKLADIGTGEGVIAFRAIERIGPTLSVVLTDVSAPMIRHAAALASQRRVNSQCSYLYCAADRLDGIADASVDVVTTRAVLAHVADKKAALRGFRRILRPGGRISIAEPLLHRWKAAQYPGTEDKIADSPIANYSEPTLFEFVRSAGFTDIHMELHIDLLPSAVRSWEQFEKAMRAIVAAPGVTMTRIAYLSATRPLV
jgi:arsenite methyltransferase